MTDLERAAELVLGWEYASHIPKIADALAAARQEGAEEMRERAAQEAQELFEYGIPAQEFAKRLRALPLTP